MKKYSYLIIGGGLAGDGATRGIRELDKDNSIGLISMEPDPPYMRPDLSKKLWKGRPLEKIWLHTEDRAELHLGRKVIELNLKKKYARDDAGDEYAFEKLLIATGGSPNRLGFGDAQVVYFRNFQNYKHLRGLTSQGKHFVVIGGSFIGSEIAAALKMVGENVTMIIRNSAIGDHIFPYDLAQFINSCYREKGVEVLTGDQVTGVRKEGNRLAVHTETGRVLGTDVVTAGIGIHPNLELAKEVGLKTADGIVVDKELRTSAPGVYAAGDVANFYYPALHKRTRVEHENNAVEMGKTAGRNMAGASEAYNHMPMFYSDLFDLGYEAVGELNSELEIVADWQKKPFQKGVIYYLKHGRVRGVLMWNVWNRVEEARALLNDMGPFKEGDLRGRIQ